MVGFVVSSSGTILGKGRLGCGSICNVAPGASVLGRQGAARLTAPKMVASPEAPQAVSGKPAPVRTKTVVITGASSGIGMYAAQNLAATGEWNVIMACRNRDKAEKVASDLGMDKDSYRIADLDLSSLDNVRAFAKYLRAENVTVDTLICNAAIWYPKDKKPRYTVDGFEETVAVNYFGHYLLVNLMLQNGSLPSRPQRGGSHSRVVFIGTETHNPDTLPGKIPPQADLADLKGLEQGFREPIAMISGKEFEPTKAYKDSKCNITFTTLFPGCVAKSGLFREKRGWFRQLFPLFQQYVTKQYVTNELAGQRAAAVASEDRFERGGAYWRWQGVTEDSEVYQKPVSWEALDTEKGERLWNLTKELVDFY